MQSRSPPGRVRQGPMWKSISAALTPTPGGCSSSSGDEGLVCANGQTFTANGSTFTATGYSDTFTTAAALTLKPLTSPPGPPTNSLVESGLGDAAGPPSACTDVANSPNTNIHDCEVGIHASVAVVASKAISDVIIGSVQGPEVFQVWAGSGGVSSLTDLTGNLTLATCDVHRFECLPDRSAGRHFGCRAVGFAEFGHNDAVRYDARRRFATRSARARQPGVARHRAVWPGSAPPPAEPVLKMHSE